MGCTTSSVLPRSVSSTIKSPQSIHDQYLFQEQIGQGTFAQTRVCVQRDTGRECAVKILRGSKQSKCEAHREWLLMKRLEGLPNVVSLLDRYNEDRCCYIVMEKCEHSLRDLLLTEPGVQEKQLLFTFRQMVLGLVQCHSMQVVHRDVKPGNFMVSNDGVVQLCNFSSATSEEPNGISGIAGTPQYMSPEMAMGRPYNQKTDVWSLGVAAYVMLFGRYPFEMDKDRESVRDPYQSEGDPESEAALMKCAFADNSATPTYVAAEGSPQPSTVACEFVQALLQRGLKSRPSARECLLLEAIFFNIEVPHFDQISGSLSGVWKKTKAARTSRKQSSVLPASNLPSLLRPLSPKKRPAALALDQRRPLSPSKRPAALALDQHRMI